MAMAMTPAALGPEIYSRGFRFSPTPQEAVTYYLPRLVSGDQAALHEVVRAVIHRADVYACDPADLARRIRPMPRTHNRFFFTVVKKGVRAAGAGSWAGQSTAEIKDKEGVQIGELKKFRYRKRGGILTDWLMEEYSSSSCVLGSGGMQPVLCKVCVSPKAALDSDAYKESAAFSAPPPPPPAAAPAVIALPAAAKRPRTPPQDPMPPPCAKRMRICAVQPAPPPQPPLAPLAPTTLSSGTAVRKMPFALPQPCAPRRRLTTPSAAQPSLASAPPPAPPAPTRPQLAPVREMSFKPPPCPCPHPLHPSATRPSFASTPPPAPPAPSRPALQPRGSAMPPRPPTQHKQQVPLPAASSVASARNMPQQAPASPCLPTVFVQPKQRKTMIDPFEAAILRGRPEAEKQTVAAPPAKLQDDDDDEDFAKELDDMLSADAEEETVAAAPIKLQDDDDDDFAKELDDMLSAESEEQTVASAPIKLQDDDEFAKVMDVLSAEAEEPTVFDMDTFFNFSEEDLEASMPASSSPCHQRLMLA